MTEQEPGEVRAKTGSSRPCPYCGCLSFRIYQNNDDGPGRCPGGNYVPMYHIECLNCFSLGPMGNTREWAAERRLNVYEGNGWAL